MRVANKQTGYIITIICVILFIFSSSSNLIEYTTNKAEYTIISGTITDTRRSSGYKNSRRKLGTISITYNNKVQNVDKIKLNFWENKGDVIEVAVNNTSGRCIRSCLVIDYSYLIICVLLIYFNICFFIKRHKQKKSKENI